MRLWRIENWSNHPVAVQREVLQELVTAAQYTEFGRKYNFSKLLSLKEFKKNVPIHEYDDLKPYIHRMMDGEENILWNTPVNWFAKSSGTTSDKSKFIPISEESLQDGHYKASKDVLSLYYQFNPDSNRKPHANRPRLRHSRQPPRTRGRCRRYSAARRGRDCLSW